MFHFYCFLCNSTHTHKKWGVWMKVAHGRSRCVQGLSHYRAASALWLRHQTKICAIGQGSPCSGMATHTVCQQLATRPFASKSGSASETKWCENVAFVMRIHCFTESSRSQQTHTVLQHCTQFSYF